MSLSLIVKNSLRPLLLVSAGTMLVSGLWLLSLGYWQALWMGVLFLVFSPLVFPLLLFPAAFFSGMMQVTATVYPKVSRIMTVMTIGWFVIVLALYGFNSFYAISMLVRGDTLWPAALWAISSALTPWAFFATKDPGNLFFIGLLWMMLATAIVMVPVFFIFGLTFWTGFLVFAGIMTATVSLQALYEKLFMKAK